MEVKADLHIHSVLSPCGDLEMSPLNIVKTALEKGLDLISVTDHNSTRQSKIMFDTAQKYGLGYIFGVEVSTKEEIHLLCYFKNFDILNKFQSFLDENLMKIKNKPDKFGYQVVVDENEDIVFEEENLLIVSIEKSIDEIIEEVRKLDGIVIPAHIDKQRFSLISQLGFIPLDLDYDALEISKRGDIQILQKKFMIDDNVKILTNSDAHYVDDIGSVFSVLDMKNLSFESFRNAIKKRK